MNEEITMSRNPTGESRRGHGRATTAVLLCVMSALAVTACGASNASPARTAGAASQSAPGGSGSASAAATASTVVAGGGSPSGEDQWCTYLTTPEIEAATGLKVVGSAPDPHDFGRCVWALSGEGRNEIGLSVYLDSTKANEYQERNCLRPISGSALKPIDGLGDTACGDTVSGGQYELYALQGNVHLRLEVSTDLNHRLEIKETAWATLARAVLAKLG